MKKVVNAKEFTLNLQDESVIQKFSPFDDICKSKILAYMKSGEITGENGSFFIDKLTMKEIEHSPFYYTDGEYEWSSEEIYYVEKYNMVLNDDFLLKIGIDGKEKLRQRKRYSDNYK